MNKKVYLSFDISTTCIGIAIFDESFTLINMKHLILKTDKDVLVENRWIAKSNIFKEYVETLKEYDVQGIYIEEPLARSNNVNTVNMLQKFNGIASYILYDALKIMPFYISVDDIRKTLCPELLVFKNKKWTMTFKSNNLDPKQYIFDKINKMIPNLDWIKNKKGELIDENYDMSDAIAVGLAVFVIDKKIVL